MPELVDTAPEPELPVEVVVPEAPAREAWAEPQVEAPPEEGAAPGGDDAEPGVPGTVSDGPATRDPLGMPADAAPVAEPVTAASVPKPVVAAPAPKPVVTAPAPPPAPMGTVRLDRAEDFKVELRGASGRRGLGNVPAGRWTVYADFGDGLAKQLDIQVGEDATVVLRCRQILAFCEVL